MRINTRVLALLLLLVLGALFYFGASTSPIIVFVFSVCIVSFVLSIYLTKWVLAKDEGPPEMVQVLSSWNFGYCEALMIVIRMATYLFYIFLSYISYHVISWGIEAVIYFLLYLYIFILYIYMCMFTNQQILRLS